MMRILIVEDHPIVRRGLKEILVEEFAAASFAEVEDFQSAYQAVFNEEWDLVLLDINLPGRDGLELLEEMRQKNNRAAVLVVSAYPEEEFAVRAFKLGAAGYLSKAQAADELVAAVNKIRYGGKYVTAGLGERLASYLGEQGQDVPHASLSVRELQVLRLIASGKTMKEIASELCLSEKTIMTYRTRIGEKLGLTNNVEITRYAFHHKLIQ